MALPIVSFEFFPPKTAAAAEQLSASLTALAPLRPEFVSVTYGAGGGTRQGTLQTLQEICRNHLPVAGHLTCVGASRQDTHAMIDCYETAGVRHILALRGDPPEGGRFSPHPEGYQCAAELVEAIASRPGSPFDISVACYPETHPDAISPEADLDNLKRKLEAGARRAITQFFFDVPVFLKFLEAARRRGITAPIVPGILPVTNFVQARKFAERCGASVPQWMADLFDGLDQDPETRKLVAAMIATEQCRALMEAGITEFHFYTLNRADLTLGICRRLGLKPEAPSGQGFDFSNITPPPSFDPSFGKSSSKPG